MIIEQEKSEIGADIEAIALAIPIAELSRQMHEPCLKEEIGDYKIDVFRVKPLYKNEWHPIGFSIVAHNRTSYRIYNAPRFDIYDTKAAIYIARASYPYTLPDGRIIPVEEWTSLRFIPGDGEPKSTEDLMFYIAEDEDGHRQPILTAMRERLPVLQGLSEDKALGHIATESRFCGVHSYARNPEDQDAFIKNIKTRKSAGDKLAGRVQTSGLGFACMSSAFLQEIDEAGLPFDIITCIMHTELSDEGLSYPLDSGWKKMPFTHARYMLGFTDAAYEWQLQERAIMKKDNKQPDTEDHIDWHDSREYSVRLDRDVAYWDKAPNYFLKASDLSTMLQLANPNIQPILQTFLSPGVSLEELFQKPSPRVLNGIDKLFDKTINFDPNLRRWTEQRGIIGSELRDYIKDNVRDGPFLRIMERIPLENGVDSYLLYAKRYEAQQKKRKNGIIFP